MSTTYFLHIYAKPKSHKNKIEKWIIQQTKDLLQVCVTAPPEGGKANQAIIILLAKTLSTKKENIKLVSGATRRYKIFKIEEWSPILAEKLPHHKPLPTIFE